MSRQLTSYNDLLSSISEKKEPDNNNTMMIDNNNDMSTKQVSTSLPVVSLINMVLTDKNNGEAAKTELDDKTGNYQLICFMIRNWLHVKEEIPMYVQLTGYRAEAVKENQLHDIWLGQ